VQGKINVVVGFVYKKYNRDLALELSKTSTSKFFGDFLGICGAVNYTGMFNAPYSTRDMEAVGLDAQLSQTSRKRMKVLPREFYEALIQAVACPPDQKGSLCFFLCVIQLVNAFIKKMFMIFLICSR
jgi:hypothetical protein